VYFCVGADLKPTTKQWVMAIVITGYQKCFKKCIRLSYLANYLLFHLSPAAIATHQGWNNCLCLTLTHIIWQCTSKCVIFVANKCDRVSNFERAQKNKCSICSYFHYRCSANFKCVRWNFDNSPVLQNSNILAYKMRI